MNKRYIFVPHDLFSHVVRGDKRGQLVTICPECHDNIYTQTYWKKGRETASLAGAATSLDFVECTQCVIRVYPKTGFFTIDNGEIERATAERTRMAMRLDKWGRWTDTRTPKDRGHVRDAVSEKMREMGLAKHPTAHIVVRSMLTPHQTQDGRFHQPEIYTLQDVVKLDRVRDILEDPFPFSPYVGNQDAVDEAWQRTRG